MDRHTLVKVYEDAINRLLQLSAIGAEQGVDNKLEEAIGNAIKAIAIITMELHEDILIGFKGFAVIDQMPDGMAASTRKIMLNRLSQPVPQDILDGLVDVGYLAKKQAPSAPAPSSDTVQ